MGHQTPAVKKLSHTETLDCLTVARRRRLIRILTEHSTPVSIGTLATELATVASGPSTGAPADGAIERCRIQLRHVDLPKLRASGLVSVDDDQRTVAVPDDETLENPLIQALLETEDDEQARMLADRRCRQILEVFETLGTRLGRAQLARELVSRRAAPPPDDDAVRSAEVGLHHESLPKLAAAGLVAYDAEDGTVEYTGPADVLDQTLTDDADVEPKAWATERRTSPSPELR